MIAFKSSYFFRFKNFSYSIKGNTFNFRQKEFIKICNELNIPMVKTYPSIKVFDVFKTVDELLEFAEGESENVSVREGLVFKSNETVDGDLISFKVISNKFLLNSK